MENNSCPPCSTIKVEVEHELQDTREDSGKSEAPDLLEQVDETLISADSSEEFPEENTHLEQKNDNIDDTFMVSNKNIEENDTISSTDTTPKINSVDIDNKTQSYDSSDSKIDHAIKADDGDTLSDIDDIKTDTSSADSEDSALGSLPPDGLINEREADARDPSDASDSGIGTESNDCPEVSSFDLTSTNDVTSNNNSNSLSVKGNYNRNPAISDTVVKIPLKSSLKRKSDGDNIEPDSKKRRFSIRFENVTVYYFPRAQGFSCVPSQGGSTLGMEWEHTRIQNFTLAEHALEQRRIHRQILQDLKNERNSLQSAILSSSEESETEEESSDISESELDLDSYYFLQPIPTRQRRGLLRAAGVRKIEAYEKDECRDIRTSRELCGCACKNVCNPDSCLCSLSGIKCQVDRLSFPCGCTKDGCKNTTGRIEFNPIRVKTHFLQTLMRLREEEKHEKSQEIVARQWNDAHYSVTSQCTNNATLNSYSFQNIHIETNFNHSFSNNFCNTNGLVQDSVPNNGHFGYGNDITSHRQLNETNSLCLEQPSTLNNHTESYTSNILQGKGPPFTTAMRFDSAINNIQKFPCDYNYPYPQNESGFQGLQTFSATSFEEFAHNSQMSMYSHYGQGYMPEYANKSDSITEHAYPCGTVTDNSYLYKNNDMTLVENKNYICDQIPKSYCVDGKSPAVESDENWFSHKTLLNLDMEQTVKDEQVSYCQPEVQSQQGDSTDTTENLGELIKKTTVESVNL